MSHNVSNNINNIADINISKVDENFLKSIIIGFRNNIIKTDNVGKFECNSSNWVINSLKNNDKDPERFLEIMKNHKESKFWFTSLIGYFYQFGIGCDLNMEKALDYYLIAINNKIDYDSLNIIDKNQLHLIVIKNKDEFNLLRNSNTIIGKYLLSLFYYKDIILSLLSEQNKFVYFLKLGGNKLLEEQFNLAIQRDGSNANNYRKVFELLFSLAEEEDSLTEKPEKEDSLTEKGNSLTEKGNSLTERFKRGILDVQYNLAICYMYGIGTQKDDEKAFDLFTRSNWAVSTLLRNKARIRREIEREKFERDLKLAILNDSIAQNNVGCYYQDNGRIRKNKIKAFHWFLKSAIAGCTDGQCNLGYCYENGIGTDKDATKAFKFYLKSAKKGHKISQSYIGYCYQNGYGTSKDEIKAFEWYTKSAKNGDEMGQNNLGSCYDHGIGTNKNEKKAFEWYAKATESGNHAVAQNNLGDCYKYGKGTDENEIKAFKLYAKAAESDSIAQTNLGDCYRYGIGTDKNEMKASGLYTKAANSGDVVAQNNLGDCYKYGLKGTKKNQIKAFEWYLKSAQKGYKMSQNNLGYCYEHGCGINKNQQKANEWYAKAAENDDAVSQNRLGRCYKYEKFLPKPVKNS